MDNEQLKRYSRHIMLPQVDYEGQEKLVNAKVLIMGCGGLGSPVAMYLASSGVGEITITDFDKVEISNLQRQIAHSTQDLGRDKVDSMAETLNGINPLVKVHRIKERLEGESLYEQIEIADVIVDTTDNFATRFAVNKACVKLKKPLVSGAVIRMEGQITVFRNDLADSPCYRCLYVEGAELGETCTQSGILAPVVGIVGSIQATETLKVIMGLGETLTGRLMLLDALTMECRVMKLRKDPHCPICGHK